MAYSLETMIGRFVALALSLYIGLGTMPLATAQDEEIVFLPPVDEALPPTLPSSPRSPDRDFVGPPPLEVPPVYETPAFPGPTLPEVRPGELLDNASKKTVTVVKTFVDPWEGTMELGINGVTGSGDSSNIWWGGYARHRGSWSTESGWGVWIHSHTRGGQNVNTLLKDARFEFPARNDFWNFFVHGFLEYDETRAFDDRLSGDTGVGFKAWDEGGWSVLLRTGLAGSQELGGDADNFHPELYWGGETYWRVGEMHRMSLNIDYYPDVVQWNDYRLNTIAAWQILIVPDWNLHLKFSLIDRYDSSPHNRHPNELAYSTLMLWAF